jgi:subtilase family serine protease
MSNRSQVLLRTISSALLILFVLSNLSYAATQDRITGAIGSGNGIALQKSLHPQALSKYDLGPVDPAFKLPYMTLMTAPSAAQQKALNKLLAEQQDRSSRNYHKWLTPAQYGEQFGLSQNDMNKITAWLKSQGFVILSIGGGRNTVIFSGTAAQVQSAFKSEIHRYNVDGEEHFANSTPLMVPSALSGIVTGIRGTHNFLMHASSTGRLNAAPGVGPRTRSDYYDGNFIFPNFLSPADVALMYDINGLYSASPAIDGTGEKLAIINRTDIFLADINDFRTGFGLTPITASNCTLNSNQVITACNDPLLSYVVVPGQTDPGVPDSAAKGDIVEADLDVEWSGAIAPGAQIVYINAPQTDVFDSLSYALNPPSGTAIPAPVVSMSFGNCERIAVSLETELQQGVAEGITIVNSSGDSGAADCDNVPNSAKPFNPAIGGQGVNYPASSTYVIAAGGTAISLADDTTNASTYWLTPNPNPANGLTMLSYIPEVAWNDDEALALYCTTAPSPNQNLCQPATGVNVTTSQVAQEYFWISAGGGGGSNCFTESGGLCTGGLPQPSWQSTLVVPNAPAGVRWVPDVSLLSSPNFPGYVFCTPQNADGTPPTYTSTCSGGIFTAVDTYGSVVGGTSAAAPVFAGIVTLLNQSLAGPSSPGLGDIHSILYTLVASNSTNGAFNPVTTGDNMVYCQAGQPTGQPAGVICPGTGIIGFNASDADPTTKYNLVAGLGSVNATHLATAWAASRASSTTAVSPSVSQPYQGESVTLTATVTPSSATGSVIFSNGTTVLGTAALNGSAQAQVSTSQLPVGANTITATYIGNGSLSSSSNTTTVTVAQPFTFVVVPPNTIMVTPGQTATAKFTLTLASGFTGTVHFTCSDPASESTCTPPADTNASGSVSFTVTTTAPTSSSLRRPFDRGTRIFYAALLPGLLGIMFTLGSRKRSLHGVRLLGLIAVLGFSTLWLGSCGGSNNNSMKNPGTPAGNYTITMTGASTSGTSTGFSTKQQITLQVQ